ncbi:ornithine cyclodeaminase family protein [Arthrobacter sp. UM1]|uniref:ornithine cyclodeaminase family protein n=1 Tax=Arthrobacter sp. UM1 TaxID=2766776 RepID=UPI001CF6D985|nr:ornithine cyclodeaminase family protein [Arthrobacter sp. UM1]MCB4209108.1 ornithine cyclodeaminase family protein [Arthrobacter sp. UM1]
MPKPADTCTGPRWIGADEVMRSLPPERAVECLRAVLDSGFNPERDGERTRLETAGGTLLQMPSTLEVAGRGVFTGVKLLTLTPRNAQAGLPVIQGVCQLFGGEDQRPLALVEGASLTAVRTPAVSLLGAQMLLDPSREGLPLRALVFGTGVQAWEHARTFAAVLPLERLDVAGRSSAKAEALAARITSELGVESAALSTEGEGCRPAVEHADLILTCTSSSEPVFSGEWVPDTAVVVAVGSHDPHSRELDDALLSRAEVLVESRTTATAEAGEIVQALASDAILSQYSLVTLAEMTLFERRDFTRPGVFKTTGMPWQDLALAVEAWACSASGRGAAGGSSAVQAPGAGGGGHVARARESGAQGSGSEQLLAAGVQDQERLR